jgi:hypothetical protein
MIRRSWHLILLCLLVLLHTSAMAAQPKAWGYLGWWLPQSWQQLPLKQLDRLLFFDLKVNADGAIVDRHGWPEQWADLQKSVQQNQVPLDLVLTLFEPDDFNRLFASVDAMKQLVSEATTLAGNAGVAGLQIDFEIYDLAQPQPIENFRTFFADALWSIAPDEPSQKSFGFLSRQCGAIALRCRRPENCRSGCVAGIRRPLARQQSRRTGCATQRQRQLALGKNGCARGNSWSCARKNAAWLSPIWV